MTQKIIREKGRSIKIMTIELDVDDMEMMLELLIWGDNVPIDELVNRINVEPTEVIRQGDILYVGPEKNIQQIQKDNIIIYSTGYLKARDVKIPTQKMLGIWDKEKDKLRKYIKSSACHVKVCLTVNISENPILYFSHEFIEFINYLNAEFEIDSYLEYDNKNNGVICDSQS